MIAIKRIVILLSLLIPSLAYGYTYQDVENWLAANPASQGCNVYVETVIGPDSKAYRIHWKCAPIGSIKKRQRVLVAGRYMQYHAGYPVQNCDGLTTHTSAYHEWVYAANSVLGSSVAKITYCDDTYTTTPMGIPSGTSYLANTVPCDVQDGGWNKSYTCIFTDTIKAEFFPIDECEDKDGDGVTTCDGDCNDNDPAINPATIWYKDSDGDGYSDGSTITICQRPNGYKLASELKATSGDCDDNNASKNPDDIDQDGYSTCTGDCNDNDSAINPAAKEECDKKDNNCNNEIDEGACDCSIELRLNSSANAANGSLSHSQEFFISKGTGLSLSMSLYYNSLYTNSGHLGTDWSHSYDITLKEFADDSVLFREGNYRRLYTLSNGSYVNQAGDYSTLVENPDSTYLLTKKDGTKYHFDTGHRLTKIEDRLGNVMTFGYTGDTLTEITDSVGRKTILSYDSSNRIIQLTTHNSQVTTFSYNSSGYLSAVLENLGVRS